jgi:hypothetical protein
MHVGIVTFASVSKVGVKHQSINQSIYQSINQSINQSMNQSINQPMFLPFFYWELFLVLKIF